MKGNVLNSQSQSAELSYISASDEKLVHRTYGNLPFIIDGAQTRTGLGLDACSNLKSMRET